MAYKKIRIAILCNDDITTNIIFSKLFEEKNIDICYVGITQNLNYFNSKGLRNIFKLFKKMSKHYWVYLSITNLIFHLTKKIKKKDFNSISYNSKINGIKIFRSHNFNNESFHTFLKTQKPDYLVIRINQILSKKTLELANKVICVHSSLLPSYKGIAAEYHALNNVEKIYGSTIFKVEQKLDQGDSLFQNVLKLDNSKSVFKLMINNNISSSELLRQKIKNFQIDQLKPPPPSYYSWPSKRNYFQFKSKGYKLLKLKEYINFLLWCIGKKNLIEV